MSGEKKESEDVLWWFENKDDLKVPEQDMERDSKSKPVKKPPSRGEVIESNYTEGKIDALEFLSQLMESKEYAKFETIIKAINELNHTDDYEAVLDCIESIYQLKLYLPDPHIWDEISLYRAYHEATFRILESINNERAGKILYSYIERTHQVYDGCGHYHTEGIQPNVLHLAFISAAKMNVKGIEELMLQFIGRSVKDFTSEVAEGFLMLKGKEGMDILIHSLVWAREYPQDESWNFDDALFTILKENDGEYLAERVESILRKHEPEWIHHQEPELYFIYKNVMRGLGKPILPYGEFVPIATCKNCGYEDVIQTCPRCGESLYDDY